MKKFFWFIWIFVFISSPAVAQNGVWYNPSEPGTGMFIDIQGNHLALGWFAFDAETGEPVWYMSDGPMADANNYMGPMWKFRDGQCVGCPYAGMPDPVTLGNISITFHSDTSATITCPMATVNFIRQIRDDTKPNCEGFAVKSSSPLSAKLHPIVLLYANDNSEHDWNDKIPLEWKPVNPSQIQITGCVQHISETYGSICYYTDGRTVRRVRRKVILKLYETFTGEIITSRTFYGGVPPTCSTIEYFYEWEIQKTKYGSAVTFDQVSSWLEEQVKK